MNYKLNHKVLRLSTQIKRHYLLIVDKKLQIPEKAILLMSYWNLVLPTLSLIKIQNLRKNWC